MRARRRLHPSPCGEGRPSEAEAGVGVPRQGVSSVTTQCPRYPHPSRRARCARRATLPTRGREKRCPALLSRPRLLRATALPRSRRCTAQPQPAGWPASSAAKAEREAASSTSLAGARAASARRRSAARGNVVQHRRQPALGLGHAPAFSRGVVLDLVALDLADAEVIALADGRNTAPTPTSPATSHKLSVSVTPALTSASSSANSVAFSV